MLKSNKNVGGKLLLRYLFPYTIILLLPIIMGTIVYGKTLKLVENEVENSNIAMLGQISTIFDQRMSEMSSIVNQLMMNTKIQSFIYVEDPFEIPKPINVMNARKEMTNFSLYNKFMLSYFVAFNKSELVLGPDITYTFKEFNDLVLKYDNVAYSDWKKEITALNYNKSIIQARSAQYNGKNLSLITWIQSLSYSENANGSIVILFDESEFRKPLEKLDISEGGWAYIADVNNQMITSVGAEGIIPEIVNITDDKIQGIVHTTIKGTNMLVTYKRSGQQELIYVAVQPYNVVMSKIKYIKDLIYKLTGVTFLTGLIIAGILAYRRTKPVKEVIKNIREYLGKDGITARNEFDYINTAMANMISDNSLLQKAVKEQKPFLTAAFFNRLLNGELQKEEDIIRLYKHIGLDMYGQCYAVAILRYLTVEGKETTKSLTDLNHAGVFIKQLLQALITCKYQVHDMDEEKLVIIFSLDTSLDEAVNIISENIENIKSSLKKNLIFDVVIAIGNIYYSITEISKSFSEAQKAFSRSMWGNHNGAIWYKLLDIENVGYYYPEEVEKRLMNLTRSGDKDDVKKLLKEILNENFIGRKLSTELLTLFVYELYGTLAKLLDQISPNNEDLSLRIRALFEKRNTNELEMFQAGLDIFSQMCDLVNEQKKSHNKNLKDKIRNFVADYYMDSNICLLTLADNFNLSEAYLSQFFKEQMGVNFSSHLENIRMEQAIMLLTQTNMK